MDDFPLCTVNAELRDIDLRAATTDPIASALQGFDELATIAGAASRFLTPIVIA